VFASLLLACSGQETPIGDVRTRNLIIISLDTLRADHLGAYGYDRLTSPAIDAIASAGTVFLDASAKPIEDLTGDEKARLRAMGYLQDD